MLAANNTEATTIPRGLEANITDHDHSPLDKHEYTNIAMLGPNVT